MVVIACALCLALVALPIARLGAAASVEQFMPHGTCFLWDPGLVILNVGSDSLIGASYVAISATLVYLYLRTRHTIPFGWVVVAFGLFIVACGGTHFMEIWTLWNPDYWGSGGLKLVTAIASVATALAVPPLVPKIVQLVAEASVSEQRRQQLEVQNRELALVNGRLEAVLSSMGNPVITTDQDGLVTDMNPAARRLTGFTEPEARGHSAADLLSIPSEQRAALMDTLTTGVPGDSHQQLILTRGGEFRMTEATTAALRDADGAIVGAVEVLADVTERERAAAALLASNAELEQFAHTVSHDLKAPLVSIQGFVERLQQECGPRLAEDGGRGALYLERIRANANRLHLLITDVLEYSRVGGLGVAGGTVDLQQLVDDIRAGLQGRLDATGGAVAVATPLPTLPSEPTALRQVVTNLLENGLKYGGSATEPPRVEVGAQETSGGWRLWVRDNGPGIAAADQERVFRLFRRLPGAVRRDPEGSGVGLATVKRAVRRLGGEIWIDSDPTRAPGTTFWFTLPRNFNVASEPAASALSTRLGTAAGGLQPVAVPAGG